jgi:hypothetical protein
MSVPGVGYGEKACQMEGFQEPPNKFGDKDSHDSRVQTVVLCLVTQVKILFTAVKWTENRKYAWKLERSRR